MTFRVFGNVKYPVPGIDTVMDVLRPGAKYEINGNKFVRWQDPSGKNPPTWNEVMEETKKQEEIHDYYEYEREREKSFPHPMDQLDMIYHDLEGWRKEIKKIKDKFPKPEGPEPDLTPYINN